MSAGIALVGDGIENPANALIIKAAAAMFGARTLFRDTKGLDGDLERISGSADLAPFPRVIACDNLPKAKSVFGFNAGAEFALLVGNERRGLSHEFAHAATDVVEIPMQSRRIDCLNVAAASAVALYYLTGPRVGPMAFRNDPASRRPDLLFHAPREHFEFGSALRSAAAFGWDRAFIEDTHAVWFNCDRAIRAEGRAAARRGKNDILLIPSTPRGYEQITVVKNDPDATPLHRVNFATGPRHLVVLPDETNSSEIDWNTYGRSVQFARLELPRNDFPYHFRLSASIALAEIARQVGGRGPKAPTAPRPPAFKMAILPIGQRGEVVPFSELLRY